MDLDNYLAHWQRFLDGFDPDPEFSKTMQFPEKRAGLYWGFVRGTRNRLMRKSFPQLLAVRPELFEKSALAEYFGACPPNSWRLIDMYRGFPTYVGTLFPDKTYYRELALYDLAIDEVNLHECEEAAICQQLPPGMLTLNPATYLLNFENQIWEWVTDITSTSEGKEVAPAPDPGSELLVASRARSPYRVLFTEPSPIAIQLLLGIGEEAVQQSVLRQQVQTATGVSDEEIKKEQDTLIERGILLQSAN